MALGQWHLHDTDAGESMVAQQDAQGVLCPAGQVVGRRLGPGVVIESVQPGEVWNGQYQDPFGRK